MKTVIGILFIFLMIAGRVVVSDDWEVSPISDTSILVGGGECAGVVSVDRCDTGIGCPLGALANKVVVNQESMATREVNGDFTACDGTTGQCGTRWNYQIGSCNNGPIPIGTDPVALVP